MDAAYRLLLNEYAERLRREHRPPAPDPVPRVPLAAYGAAPAVAGSVGRPPGWPVEDWPGPQAENGGLTPGWPPDPPPPPEVAAAVGELAAAARVTERAGAAARQADKDHWQLAQWLAEQERRIAALEIEVEELRRAGRPAGASAAGRPGAGG